jgi:hypothetical protein
MEGVSKRSHEVTPMESPSTWVDSSFDGADESERETHKKSTESFWLEICDVLETEEGADMIEHCMEDKLYIVADLSTREIAEKRLRVGRTRGESGSFVDAVSSLETSSVLVSNACLRTMK